MAETTTTKRKGIFHTSYDVSDTHEIEARLSGSYTQETYGSARMNSFSADDMFDRSLFARSTVDLSLDFGYGPQNVDLFNIEVHSTFRMRHKWGDVSEVNTDQIDIDIAGVTESDTSASLTKHLFYTREAWMKIMLGELEERDDYIQLGLFPFSLGRGVSLGSAYRATGFLGFTPGFSIDQFAPGLMLRYDAYPNHLCIDSYFALLENKHISRYNNAEVIRANEILENGESTSRGTHSHAYLLAFRSQIKPIDSDNHKLHIEPYVVYQHAPDQDIEYHADSNLYLKTFGIAAGYHLERFKCGLEIATNRGHQVVKAWDRNYLQYAINSSGALEQQYSHVYSDATLETNARADTTNIALVDNSVKSADNNSYYLADYTTLKEFDLTNGVGATRLYNAVDRFRPKQIRHFDGWFILADGEYEIKPDVLSLVVGAGWASGRLSTSKDVNTLGEGTLLNENYSGFIPMQSVYSGERLRHFMMLSGKAPRFAKEQPWESSDDLAKKNVISPISKKDILNSFSNISFLGGNVEWDVQQFKKYNLHLASNVIHYWSPESPFRKDGSLSSPSLGTEVSLEWSFKIFDRVKISGFGGVFFPGAQYKQMKEDGAAINKIIIGDTPAYVFNLGGSFSF